MIESLAGIQSARRVLVVVVILGAFGPPRSTAQDVATEPKVAPTAAIETGQFRLHKFEQPIGQESYEIRRDGTDLVITDKFKFVDRGAPVISSSTLRTSADLTPKHFETKGKVSRFTPIDDAIDIDGGVAKIREGQETREVKLPERFFTIAGYSPVVIQQELLRYAKGHGVKGVLATVPGGEVTIDARGADALTVGGKKVELERFILTGLIWGREAVWTDATGNLVAVVGVDAEFDHFEAIRDGYEDALPTFVSHAAEDGMAALAKISQTISPTQPKVLAVTGGTLVDGTGAPPVKDAVIVVENGKITAAGPAGKVTIPAGATVVDAKGKTVLPGLWDMHAHFEQVEWGPIYLAAGVTTVRDCGNEFDYIKTVRDVLARGEGLGPRLLLAGIVDGDSDMALGIVRANDAQQAQAVVKRYHDAGFQQIKIYSSMKKDVVAAICAAAHQVGMTVTGHIPEGMTAFDGVLAGMDQINHVQYVADVMKLKKKKGTTESGPAALDLDGDDARRTIQLLKAHGTVVDPTVTVFEWSMNTTDIPYAKFEPGLEKVARELRPTLNGAGLPPAFAPRARAKMDQYLAVVGALHRAGITIVAGTDQVVPGHSLHRELEIYVKAGLTPMEAIQSATIVPARVMKLDRELGTVEAGKIADLVIVNGDPLRSISEIRQVQWVISAGRLFECAPLWTSVGFKP